MLLHRFMSFEQFVDIVVNNRMYLTQVIRWEDPHEARSMRALVKEILAEEADERVPDVIRTELIAYTHKSIYGQCWTVLNESDALWRIYSPDKLGVRISVEQSNIIDSVKRCGINSKEDKVVYQTFDEALQHARALKSGTEYSFDPATCCFSKRVEFQHEREYRVCATLFPGLRLDLRDIPFTAENIVTILEKLRELTYQPVHYYDFDPTLIDEVVLDPRAPTWFLETVRKLCEQYINKTAVRKSELYDAPTI